MQSAENFNHHHSLLCTLYYNLQLKNLFWSLNNKEKHSILAYLGQINFIMLHDELPPVQHPITIHFKKIHILNKILVDKWKWLKSLYESHTYNMWLAEIVYHVAYKKPHASLLNAKAIRQSFSCSIHGRLSDNAQV